MKEIKPSVPEEKPQKRGCHSDHRQRMRERYQQTGLSGFSAHEVLEVLLFSAIPRHNTNPIAHDMLTKRDSLAHVLTDPPEDVPGAGEKAREMLKALNHRLEASMAAALSGKVSESQLYTTALWYLRRNPNLVYLVVTDGEGMFVGLHLLSPEALSGFLSALTPEVVCHAAFCGRIRDRAELIPGEQLGMVLVFDEKWQGTWL